MTRPPGSLFLECTTQTKGSTRQLLIAVATFTVAVLPHDAFAYIGPGTGLSALGTLLALIASAAFAVIGFVWYPLKRICRRRRTAQPESKNPTAKADK